MYYPISLRYLFIYFLFLLSTCGISQKHFGCGSDQVNSQIEKRHPNVERAFESLNDVWRNWYKEKTITKTKAGDTTFDLVSLPVIFHNLSSTDIWGQVGLLEANLNALSANFENAKIEFCLVAVDGNGNPVESSEAEFPIENGLLDIAIEGSILAVSGAIQNNNPFDPTEFINIYVVDDIANFVAGFAYLPSAHGLSYDGIYIKSEYITDFDSNNNISVLTHEMGHYLGLLHTFGRCQPTFAECSCTNDNCLFDGDMVCDTPPEMTTSLNNNCQSDPANTCSSDGISLMSDDQVELNPLAGLDLNDLTDNFMDYGPNSCASAFTDGQVMRMRCMIDPIVGPRSSLLNSNKCNADCQNISMCELVINNTPTTQILDQEYPNTILLEGSSVQHEFSFNQSESCLPLDQYQWQLYENNLVSTSPIQQGSDPNFTATFDAPGNYELVLTGIIANSNPICGTSTSVLISVVRPPIDNGNGSGNCIDLSWDDFDRISYEGGWVYSGEIDDYEIRDESSTGPIMITGNTSTSNNERFAIISGSIPEDDPTFGGASLPSGIKEVMRIGQVIDGDPNNDIIPGSANYVTYTFQPTEEHNKLRIWYMGMGEQAPSLLSRTDNTHNFSITGNGVSNSFGLRFAEIQEDGLIYGTTHYPTEQSFLFFNSFSVEISSSGTNNVDPQMSQTTIAGSSNYIKTNGWNYYDLDLSTLVCADKEVMLTFYARSNSSASGLFHSYAYFGFQCIPSNINPPIEFDFPNVSSGCGNSFVDEQVESLGNSCYGFFFDPLPFNEQNNPRESPLYLQEMTVCELRNGEIFMEETIEINLEDFSESDDYRIRGSFVLCKENDERPFAHFQVKYDLPCYQYKDDIYIHQGFQNYTVLCEDSEANSLGGDRPEGLPRTQIFCDELTLTLDKPCWYEEGTNLNYQWQIFQSGWFDIIGGNQESITFNSPTVETTASSSQALRCNDVRRVIYYLDPYCGQPETLSSELYRVSHWNTSAANISPTSISDVCLGENVVVNAAVLDLILNNCFPDNSVNQYRVEVYNEAGEPVFGTFYNEQGGLITMNSHSFTQDFMGIIYPDFRFEFENTNSESFDLVFHSYTTVNVGTTEECGEFERIRTFVINVDDSAIGGEINMVACSNPAQFTSVNTDNNNGFGYSWEYSFDQLVWVELQNSNSSDYETPTGFSFSNYPVYIRRRAASTQNCSHVAYSNSIVIDSEQNLLTPTFPEFGPVCIGDELQDLPIVSNNDISGFWSPDINNQQTTTYTFTPDDGQCANQTSLTIEVRSFVTPNFVQAPSYCVGDDIPDLPSTSLNEISGTWSPQINNQQTTTYLFTPHDDQCAYPTKMSIAIHPSETPNFNQVGPYCQGDKIPDLPTSSINEISGTWSPDLNNQQTTTYTFTPDNEQCTSNTTMTINIDPSQTPTFTQVGPFCQGDNIPALPTSSINDISGFWSPQINNQQTTTYTFTPDDGQCAYTTSMTVVIEDCGPCLSIQNLMVECATQGDNTPEICDDQWTFWVTAVADMPSAPYVFFYLPSGEQIGVALYDEHKQVATFDYNQYPVGLDITVCDGVDLDCCETFTVIPPKPGQCSPPSCQGFAIKNAEVIECNNEALTVCYDISGTNGECWNASVKIDENEDIHIGQGFGDQINICFSLSGEELEQVLAYSENVIILQGEICDVFNNPDCPDAPVNSECNIDVPIKYDCCLGRIQALDEKEQDIKHDGTIIIQPGQTVTLCALLNQNEFQAEYQYYWSNAEKEQCIKVKPHQSTQYFVKVEDKDGCLYLIAITIIVANECKGLEVKQKCDDKSIILTACYDGVELGEGFQFTWIINGITYPSKNGTIKIDQKLEGELFTLAVGQDKELQETKFCAFTDLLNCKGETKLDIKSFPNPSKSGQKIYIACREDHWIGTKVSFWLTTATGKPISSGSMKMEKEILIYQNELAPGSYIIKLRNDENNEVTTIQFQVI